MREGTLSEYQPSGINIELYYMHVHSSIVCMNTFYGIASHGKLEVLSILDLRISHIFNIFYSQNVLGNEQQLYLDAVSLEQ